MAVSIIHPKQLGTGTRDGTKFLRDDGTWQTAGGGVSDGDKGDVVVSGSGAVWTLKDPFKKTPIHNTYSALGSSTAGETPWAVDRLTTNITLNNGFFRILPIWIPKAGTITGGRWYQSTQGNYTGNNYNGIGLYSYNAGALTLEVSSTNDADIWKAASNSWASKAFSSTFAASQGLYFLAILYCNSSQSTAPAIGGTAGTAANVQLFDFPNSAKLTAQITGQTSFPASTSMSSMSSSGVQYYFSLY